MKELKPGSIVPMGDSFERVEPNPEMLALVKQVLDMNAVILNANLNTLKMIAFPVYIVKGGALDG